MMEWTDRHAGAVLHGDAERHLAHDPIEHPLALQLGGSDPGDLAEAAKTGEAFGYDEINLNIGCPSERAGAGRFGACLMAEPELVRDGVGAMIEAVDIPVTVKSRTGIDSRDSYEELSRFIETVALNGCRTFIIHARKALLSGLSPKQNREVPPLQYDYVTRIKEDFPDLEIVLNGGLLSIDDALAQLPQVDGAMIGRAAYQDPWILHDADRRVFGATDGPATRHAVVDEMLPYIERQVVAGVPLPRITTHMLGLFNGMPGARAWRRRLSEEARRAGAGPETVRAAADLVPDLPPADGDVPISADGRSS
jgi:tRNA-dihydrouridine synthase A